MGLVDSRERGIMSGGNEEQRADAGIYRCTGESAVVGWILDRRDHCLRWVRLWREATS